MKNNNKIFYKKWSTIQPFRIPYRVPFVQISNFFKPNFFLKKLWFLFFEIFLSFLFFVFCFFASIFHFISQLSQPSFFICAFAFSFSRHSVGLREAVPIFSRLFRIAESSHTRILDSIYHFLVLSNGGRSQTWLRASVEKGTTLNFLHKASSWLFPIWNHAQESASQTFRGKWSSVVNASWL